VNNSPTGTIVYAGTQVVAKLNGNTITTGTGVLTLAAGKTLTASNTLTLAGTDATTQTFPTTSATIARTDAAQTFTGDQTLATGNLVIGTSGKGIDFSATPGTAGMTSELLADYEEGTWTPSIGGNATYTAQSGQYTKIGRLVTFFGDLTINVQGTGDAGTISGLPFTVPGNNPVYVGYFAGVGALVSSISPFTGATSINLYGVTAAASTSSGLNLMTSGARLMFQGSYEV
jgi:hypothetical protein